MSDWLKYCQEENWHPAAKVFPVLPGGELWDMAADIKANGLQNPIALFEGKVLDGRNRLLACQIAGIEPQFREWEPNGRDPIDWVISQNIHRRHLTVTERALAALDIEKLRAVAAKERMSRGGGSGLSGKERFPDPEKGQARDQAAEEMGVNPHYVTDLKRIEAEAPDLIDQMRGDAQNDNGTPKMTIPKAMKIMERRREGKPAAPRDFRKHRTPDGHYMLDMYSLLQKSIRQADEKGVRRAIRSLYDENFGEACSERLVDIMCEDVDIDEELEARIEALQRRFIRLYKKRNPHKPELLPLMRMGLILLRAEKSRLVDDAVTVTWGEELEYKTLPDVVYDKHTLKGSRMGRRNKHFCDEGAKLVNESATPNPYRERARAILLKRDAAEQGETPTTTDSEEEAA